MGNFDSTRRVTAAPQGAADSRTPSHPRPRCAAVLLSAALLACAGASQPAPPHNLPCNWVAIWTAEEQAYFYYNTDTGYSVWELPGVPPPKAAGAPPSPLPPPAPPLSASTPFAPAGHYDGAGHDDGNRAPPSSSASARDAGGGSSSSGWVVVLMMLLIILLLLSKVTHDLAYHPLARA
jgi:hypothetical protein